MSDRKGDSKYEVAVSMYSPFYMVLPELALLSHVPGQSLLSSPVATQSWLAAHCCALPQTVVAVPTTLPRIQLQLDEVPLEEKRRRKLIATLVLVNPQWPFFHLPLRCSRWCWSRFGSMLSARDKSSGRLCLISGRCHWLPAGPLGRNRNTSTRQEQTRKRELKCLQWEVHLTFSYSIQQCLYWLQQCVVCHL